MIVSLFPFSFFGLSDVGIRFNRMRDVWSSTGLTSCPKWEHFANCQYETHVTPFFGNVSTWPTYSLRSFWLCHPRSIARSKIGILQQKENSFRFLPYELFKRCDIYISKEKLWTNTLWTSLSARMRQNIENSLELACEPRGKPADSQSWHGEGRMYGRKCRVRSM